MGNISKEKISNIVEDYFKEFNETDKFLVDVKITPQNKIMVFLDGDKGITVSDCAEISRYIENFFDRSREDFELEVSSAGIGKPLIKIRQYQKNIGRNLVVRTVDEKKITGKLTRVEENGIELQTPGKQQSGKSPKDDGKGDKINFINFKEIKEAKIKVDFNP